MSKLHQRQVGMVEKTGILLEEIFIIPFWGRELSAEQQLENMQTSLKEMEKTVCREITNIEYEEKAGRKAIDKAAKKGDEIEVKKLARKYVLDTRRIKKYEHYSNNIKSFAMRVSTTTMDAKLNETMIRLATCVDTMRELSNPQLLQKTVFKLNTQKDQMETMKEMTSDIFEMSDEEERSDEEEAVAKIVSAAMQKHKAVRKEEEAEKQEALEKKQEKENLLFKEKVFYLLVSLHRTLIPN